MHAYQNAVYTLHDRDKRNHINILVLQLSNHLVTLLDPGNSIVDKLINDSFGGLLLVDNCGTLAHQVRAELLERVITVIVVLLRLRGSITAVGLDTAMLFSFATHESLKINLIRDGALGGQLLHLLDSVGLPVVDVWVVANTHGATGEDNSTDVIVVTSSADGILVSLGSTSLISENEAGSNPDTAGTHHKSRGEELAVVNTPSGNDLHGASGDGGLVALASLDDCGNQNGGGNITGVATTLSTLGADDVDAEVKALLNVLDVADHVHVQDTGLLQLLDDMLGGDTDGRDEQLGTRLDDDVDELVELALGVIVAVGWGKKKGCIVSLSVSLDVVINGRMVGAFKACDCAPQEDPAKAWGWSRLGTTYLVLRALPPTWGRSKSTPKGAFLSVRYSLSSEICSRSMSGV